MSHALPINLKNLCIPILYGNKYQTYKLISFPANIRYACILNLSSIFTFEIVDFIKCTTKNRNDSDFSFDLKQIKNQEYDYKAETKKIGINHI